MSKRKISFEDIFEKMNPTEGYLSYLERHWSTGSHTYIHDLDYEPTFSNHNLLDIDELLKASKNESDKKKT